MDLSQIKETNKKLINSSIKENRRVSVGDYNINYTDSYKYVDQHEYYCNNCKVLTGVF